MDAREIDFGPDLDDPVALMAGAIRVYGLAGVVTALCEAVRQTREPGPFSAIDEAEAAGLLPTMEGGDV